MKHLEKFEKFTHQNSPSKDDLTNYFICNECNALWRDYDKFEKCKFCNSKNISDLTEDEWYEKTNDRLEPEEKFTDNDRK